MNRFPRMLFLALLLLSACLAGCGEEEDMIRVDMDRREPITMPEPTSSLTYAYLPQYSHTISYGRHHMLVQYLEQETGFSMRQVFPDTFAEHLEMVERGEIDISYANPFIYLKLAAGGSTAFARIIEPSGEPHFRGQIIVRSGNPAIHRIGDCLGKRWIAVDPGSAGGYLFPLGLFLEHAIGLDDFAEVAFAPGPGGKQEKVVLAVHAGVFDIGTIREGTLDLLADKIDLNEIRVLAETRSYPGWVYSARPGLDKEIVDRISRAMFALDLNDPDHAVILGAANIRGIIPSTDPDYDPVRELVSTIDAAMEDVQGPSAEWGRPQ